MKLTVELVKSFNPHVKDMWIQGSHQGSFKYCTALLLSSLVNLKRLYLHAIFCKPNGFVPLVFDYGNIMSIKRRFPRLEQVEKDFRHWDA